MAQTVLGFATSHGPQLRMTPDKWALLQEKDKHDPRFDYEALLARNIPNIEDEITPQKFVERYESCQKALQVLKNTVAEISPDVIVVIGNDQHEQFMEDNMPMFSIYYGNELPIRERQGPGRDAALQKAWSSGAREWRNAQEPVGDSFQPGHPELAKHIIQHFVNQNIDISVTNKLQDDIGAGHAFAFLYRQILPEGNIPIIPLMVNCFYPPNQPTVARCYDVGKELRAAIDSWESDARVAIMASGGLSHFIIDEEIDRIALAALESKDAETLKTLPNDRLILGTTEIRNWVTLGGAMEDMTMNLIDYQPCYRTLAGTGCAMGFATWS